MKKQEIANWLEIKPNEKINELIDKLPDMYDSKTSEYNNDIHTTHITAECLRQSYFRITIPKPTTSIEAKNFVVGEAQHTVLQNLLGPLLKTEVEKKILTEIKNGQYVGIVSRIDMYADKSEYFEGGVIEIKTSQSFKREIKQNYLRQIKLYMAATNTRKALLIIIWQNAQMQTDENGESVHAVRHIDAFDVTLSKKELENAYEDYKKKYYELTDSLLGKTPEKLFAVKQDINLRKTVCRWCKYKAECESLDPPEKRFFRIKSDKNV